VCGFDLTEFNKYRWNPHYEPVDMREIECELITNPFPVFDFDFREDIEFPKKRRIRIPVIRGNNCKSLN
jgi:hypothetical protein